MYSSGFSKGNLGIGGRNAAKSHHDSGFFEEEKLELSETLIFNVEGASSSTVDTNQPFIDSIYLLLCMCIS